MVGWKLAAAGVGDGVAAGKKPGSQASVGESGEARVACLTSHHPYAGACICSCRVLSNKRVVREGLSTRFRGRSPPAHAPRLETTASHISHAMSAPKSALTCAGRHRHRAERAGVIGRGVVHVATASERRAEAAGATRNARHRHMRHGSRPPRRTSATPCPHRSRLSRAPGGPAIVRSVLG